ncbi:hypothetical protein EV356DRAFT_497668 [Viridothelium virens]|uniref:Uncharacterized protein n=1 Tax=Viridothelium virens TaxID=1048519 RepID=A0A6A6HFU5_VIRVR|nr:hypothetical protein EV356DRAFT_497668 [Viridothelium virens]
MLKYFSPNRTKKASDTEDQKRGGLVQEQTRDPETKDSQSVLPSTARDVEESHSDGAENKGVTDAEPSTSRQSESQHPVLNDEDEKFLEQITSEDEAALPTVQPTIVLDDGRKLEGEEALEALRERAEAQRLKDGAGDTIADKQKSSKRPKPAAFPSQAEAEAATMAGTLPGPASTVNEDDSANEKKKTTNYWAYVPTMPNMQLPSVSSSSLFQDRSRERMADSLQSAANAFKAGEGVPLNPDGTVNQEEATKQQAHDLSNVLSKLNLSAINNRVFSLSSESQDLLEKFNVVLRDLVNGGPTAYHDLEKLLDERSKQLSTMWSQLPPFVQTLVKSLPAKMGSSFGPELFAAAAEKPDAKMSASSTSAASASEVKIPDAKKKTKKNRMPSMKSLVTEKGAVVQMLRSILNFLQARFPAFVSGTNVLMSLAVFGTSLSPSLLMLSTISPDPLIHSAQSSSSSSGIVTNVAARPVLPRLPSRTLPRLSIPIPRKLLLRLPPIPPSILKVIILQVRK